MTLSGPSAAARLNINCETFFKFDILEFVFHKFLFSGVCLVRSLSRQEFGSSGVCLFRSLSFRSLSFRSLSFRSLSRRPFLIFKSLFLMSLIIILGFNHRNLWFFILYHLVSFIIIYTDYICTLDNFMLSLEL